MKKFFITLMTFSAAFILVEKMFYVLLIVSPSLEIDTRLDKVIKGQMNKDIIVLGSSRGARNILAGQIEDSLCVSAYNLSYPGSDIEFHEYILRMLLRFNKKPGLILLAVDDPFELLPSESIKFRLDRLYPLSGHEVVNNELINRGEKNFLSDYLALARINRANFDLRKKHFSALDTIDDYGSMPISFQRTDRDFFYNDTVCNYHSKEELPDKVEAFLKFQELCFINKVRLLLVFSPNYKMHNSLFENRLRQLSSPDVSLYVYDTLNKIYLDKSIFYDEAHLQTTGAILFTNEIIKELRTSENTPGNNKRLL